MQYPSRDCANSAAWRSGAGGDTHLHIVSVAPGDLGVGDEISAAHFSR